MDTVALSMRMLPSPHGGWRDAIDQEWGAYLHRQNIQMRLVPNDREHCAAYLENISALILTGGDDIVQGKPRVKSDDPKALRDETETILIEHALAKNIPILGVCRGMQMLQWFAEGPLTPSPKDVAHAVAKDHDVSFAESGWSDLFDDLETMTVNSFHNLWVPSAASAWEVVATGPGGCIEALGDRKKNVLGVMWHPERPFSDTTAASFHATLIHRFIEATK